MYTGVHHAAGRFRELLCGSPPVLPDVGSFQGFGFASCGAKHRIHIHKEAIPQAALAAVEMPAACYKAMRVLQLTTVRGLRDHAPVVVRVRLPGQSPLRTSRHAALDRDALMR